MKASK